MTNSAFYRVVGTVLQCVLFAGFGVMNTQAQESSAQKIGIASLNEVANELNERFGAVRFHRDEMLEDRFVLHGLQTSAFGLLPRFFQIQKPRFDNSQGFVVENTTSAIPTMYVAASSDGRKLYRLYGFPTSEEEFNRLIADGPTQKVTGKSDAETRGLLCAEVVYGLSAQWWVVDPFNAQLQAAEHFFSAGNKDGLLRGEKWWKSIKGDHTTLTIKTAKNDHGGFSVSLPLFWAPVEGDVVPQIRTYKIEVSENGTCHMNRQPVSILK